MHFKNIQIVSFCRVSKCNKLSGGGIAIAFRHDLSGYKLQASNESCLKANTFRKIYSSAKKRKAPHLQAVAYNYLKNKRNILEELQLDKGVIFEGS